MAKKYRFNGSYEYNEKTVPYSGIVYIGADKIRGAILDDHADCLALSVEGKITSENGLIALEFKRKAMQPVIPQNTLSDPMGFTLSKKDSVDLTGTYEGSWKFLEECSNIKVGIDESGEKAIIFHEDTNTTGRATLSLEEFL